MRKAHTPFEYGFTYHDRTKLRKALHTSTDARVYRRAHAVYLFSSGMPPQDIADLEDASVQWVYSWIERYLVRHSIEDLHDQPRSGRPLTADQITPARIITALTHNPANVGYASNVWTVPLLTNYLSRIHNTFIKPRTLRHRMKEANLIWKRPRYIFAERAGSIGQKKGGYFAV